MEYHSPDITCGLQRATTMMVMEREAIMMREEDDD